MNVILEKLFVTYFARIFCGTLVTISSGNRNLRNFSSTKASSTGRLDSDAVGSDIFLTWLVS